ncbi:MAG: hypothetical protein IKO53_06790 [Lachnospiraceae bacterium]|nr:hypothetical protein [Lachnospiraceae bacterium]
MMDLISNVIVGIAILICIAALVFTLGFDNGWFSCKKKVDGNADKENESEEKEDE